MDEEDEDLLDLFADDSDPLFSTDVVDQYLESDKGRTVDKSEENGDLKPDTKPADEATALAEIPNYTPIAKDKDVNMDVKVTADNNLEGNAYSEITTEPLSEEQKIDSTLSEIIVDNKRREDRKRQLHMLVDEALEARGRPKAKRRYMTKNGVQLCLRPRRDISKLSEQDIGNELARCLDEVSVNEITHVCLNLFLCVCVSLCLSGHSNTCKVWYRIPDSYCVVTIQGQVWLLALVLCNLLASNDVDILYMCVVLKIAPGPRT